MGRAVRGMQSASQGSEIRRGVFMPVMDAIHVGIGVEGNGFALCRVSFLTRGRYERGGVGGDGVDGGAGGIGGGWWVDGDIVGRVEERDAEQLHFMCQSPGGSYIGTKRSIDLIVFTRLHVFFLSQVRSCLCDTTCSQVKLLCSCMIRGRVHIRQWFPNFFLLGPPFPPKDIFCDPPTNYFQNSKIFFLLNFNINHRKGKCMY